MTPVPDHLEITVQKVLDELAGRGPKEAWGDRQWTAEVKDALCHLGNSLGYRTYASGCTKATTGAWLFDLTWTEESETDAGRYLVRFPLVVESEWHPKGASDDFQKLMAARASHRLMLLVPQHGQSPTQSVRDLITEVWHFAGSAFEDRYLFACWLKDENRFEYTLHVVGAQGA